MKENEHKTEDGLAIGSTALLCEKNYYEGVVKPKDVIEFKGDKLLASWIEKEGNHSLLIYEDDDAVIGEPNENFKDYEEPLMMLKFHSKGSVQSMIDRLTVIRDAF